MPSPFPGMNPYLERPSLFHDFHERFIPQAAAALSRQLRPRYIVRIDDNVYLQGPDPVASPPRHIGRPDVHVAEHDSDAGARTSAAVLAPPLRVVLPDYDELREGYLEIVDREDGRVVTLVELLSPSNKEPGKDFDAYQAKRRTWLAGPANLVEIDLLRAGRRPPTAPPCGSQYAVLVSPAVDRPQAGCWPIALRQALPTIPVPVDPDVPPARLDLKAVLDQVYDDAGYEDYVYDRPPEPPLNPDDQAWADRLLGEAAR